MEIVIIIFALVAGSIGFSAWKNSKSPNLPQTIDKHEEQEKINCVRKCLACGQEGEMKTWIANYVAPKIIIFVGFVLGYLPGVIFLLFYWGKYKCQNCGAVGKNTQI